MVDRDRYWHYSPLTGYKYNRDHRLLPKIENINSIDQIVVKTFQNRLVRDNEFTVDTIYGHKDREFRKLLSTPSILIENRGITYLGEVRVENIFERIPNTDDFLVNQHPIYYKFTYGLTVIEDSIVNLHRLFLAVTELVFPQKYGQRWITLSLYEDNNVVLEHRKRIEIGEPTLGTFALKDRYWYTFEITFFVVLYPIEWEQQFGVNTLRVILTSLPDTSVVLYQKDITL
jgi:hypothetical protein